jgi:deazaflavin-dependent oxidoreductase (nitroreductase family)
MEGTTRLSPLRHMVTRFVNPVTRTFAGRVPGFGIVTHRGLRTGRLYRTPINAFRDGDGYLFVLTYGSDAAWVRNVMAAGRCSLRTRGRDVPLAEPQLIVDPTRRLMPAPIRFVGRIDRVTEFLRMRVATPSAPDPNASDGSPSPPRRSP